MPDTVRKNIILSNGTEIAHTRMDNGAQDARVIHPVRVNGEMTAEEWKEYCGIILQNATQREVTHHAL